MFDAISQFAYRKIEIRKKGEVARYVSQRNRAHSVLREWASLYRYYSKFTESNYCYSSAKSSEIQFKKRYFLILKSYFLMRRAHKTNIIIAENKFFDRYVRICFQNWAYFYLHKNKMLRVSKAAVGRRTAKKLKFTYFRAFQRAFENSLKAETYRMTMLK